MTHEVSGAAGHGQAGGDPDLAAPAAKPAPPLPAVPPGSATLADPDGAYGHTRWAARRYAGGLPSAPCTAAAHSLQLRVPGGSCLPVRGVRADTLSPAANQSGVWARGDREGT